MPVGLREPGRPDVLGACVFVSNLTFYPESEDPMNLSDTFYIALCMTVLILGVVYWFWTQNQFMLRKINLLENIVYEMKSMLPQSVADSPGGEPLKPAEYPPAPSSVLGEDEDLLHEELHTELEPPSAVFDDAPARMPEAESHPAVTAPVEQTLSDDLQPGGVGSGMPVVVAKENSGLLESMTLKELRRMAEQRSISGASTLRKQQLIDALKADVPKPVFESKEGVLELK